MQSEVLETPPAAAAIDLFSPVMIFLDADGNEVAPDSGQAVAVELPQYGRTYDLTAYEAKNLKDAEKQAKACTTLGKSDWQVCYDKELELLLDRRHCLPATYPQLARHTPTNNWYITRTKHPSVPSRVAFVSFYGGYVSWSVADGSGLLRLVRLSPARQ